jgi:hypothetical protein
MQTTPGTPKFPLETSPSALDVHIFQNIPGNKCQLTARTPKPRNGPVFPFNDKNFWKKIQNKSDYYFQLIFNFSDSGSPAGLKVRN